MNIENKAQGTEASMSSEIEFQKVEVVRKNKIARDDQDSIKNTQVQSFFALTLAVAFAYFAFGAITNVAGAIIPKIRDTYEVSSSLAAFLAATFFLAYGLTSIPWGMFMEKSSKKTTLILSSLITTLGVVLFAGIQGFVPNMVAMFLCGIGITGIQVAINPLVSEISDPKKYSRNLTLFMVINGAGGYAAPHLVTLIQNNGLNWTVSYWVFTAIALVMTFALSLPQYPKAEQKVVEQAEVIEDKKSDNLTIELLSSKPLIYLYALGIFLYVGVEVGVANTISFYLEDKLAITEVLGSAAEAAKNGAIANYWFGLLAGRLLGSIVLDRVAGKYAIMSYISLAAVALFVTTQADINVALWSFPVVGFFISIMFPTIFSTATNAFEKQYSSAISGILCTAIIGGAAVGPAIAALAEANKLESGLPNWDIGLIVAFACYAYIFIVGLASKKQ